MLFRNRIERETLLKARIKELENIICPAELHDFQEVDKWMSAVDGIGTVECTKRFVCKRCLKAIERSDI